MPFLQLLNILQQKQCLIWDPNTKPCISITSPTYKLYTYSCTVFSHFSSNNMLLLVPLKVLHLLLRHSSLFCFLNPPFWISLCWINMIFPIDHFIWDNFYFQSNLFTFPLSLTEIPLSHLLDCLMKTSPCLDPFLCYGS